MPAPPQPPVVWITGASSGIGEALAHTYANAPGGAELILSARSADKLEALKSALPEPDRVRVLPVDLNLPDSLPEVIEAALSWKGRVDVLVNNAGISQRSQILDTDPAILAQHIHDIRLTWTDHFHLLRPRFCSCSSPFYGKAGEGSIWLG